MVQIRLERCTKFRCVWNASLNASERIQSEFLRWSRNTSTNASGNPTVNCVCLRLKSVLNEGTLSNAAKCNKNASICVQSAFGDYMDGQCRSTERTSDLLLAKRCFRGSAITDLRCSTSISLSQSLSRKSHVLPHLQITTGIPSSQVKPSSSDRIVQLFSSSVASS